MMQNLSQRRHFIIGLGAGVLYSVLGLSGLAQDQDDATGRVTSSDQADSLRLPDDPSGPVFEFALSGSQLNPPSRDQRKSKLQLYADGKVVVGGVRGSKEIVTKISRAELNDFLDFVVNKNRFFKIESADIEARMKGKKRLDVNDGNSSIFTVHLKRGSHEVSVYTLWNAIRNFPDFEEVQRLGAIEKRCNAVISKINLGDRGDEVLSLVNAKVKELGLGLQPFTLDEMRLATPLGNGGFQVSFERPLADGGGGASVGAPQKMHAIYFKRNKASAAKVTFFNLPKNK